jgi:hypothetical protein
MEKDIIVLTFLTLMVSLLYSLLPFPSAAVLLHSPQSVVPRAWLQRRERICQSANRSSGSLGHNFESWQAHAMKDSVFTLGQI